MIHNSGAVLRLFKLGCQSVETPDALWPLRRSLFVNPGFTCKNSPINCFHVWFSVTYSGQL